jgi:hypothetical protein
MVEEVFIERTAANSPFRQKAVRMSLEAMREDLAGAPQPLTFVEARSGAHSVVLAPASLRRTYL